MENFMKTNTFNKVLVLAAILFLTANCNKNDDKKEEEQTPDDKIAYILNEGKFQDNNASITKRNLTRKTFSTDYFNAINGFKLGDVLQSMGETNDKYFIVVNNSAKIEVVNKSTFELLFTIDDIGSPRYFLAINDTLAYVTDIFTGAIHQINPNNGSKYPDIPVNGWSEQLHKVEDKVYVCLWGASNIGVINTITQQITDSIMLDTPPLQMAKDKFNKLWVMSSDFVGTTKLYRINPESNNIENAWEFAVDKPITQLAINPDGSFIYYGSRSDNGVTTINKLDVTFNGNELNPVKVIETKVLSLYGLNVNNSGDIFACDAYDFAQQGIVYLYHSDNDLEVDSIPAGGISPNGVVFLN